MNTPRQPSESRLLLLSRLRAMQFELGTLIEHWYQSDLPWDDERQVLAAQAFDDVQSLRLLLRVDSEATG